MISLSKHRLELFTDAVLAIVMTIMVLDLRTPESGWPYRVARSRSITVPLLIGFVLVVKNGNHYSPRLLWAFP